MKKILTRKGAVLIIIPSFIVFLQVMFRLTAGQDLNTIGITLGALGLGQIIPFLYFDHFIINKVLGIKPVYSYDSNELSITYKLQSNIIAEDIESSKNYLFAATFCSLGLFLVILYLGLNKIIIPHIIFGVISCSVSWYILVFK